MKHGKHSNNDVILSKTPKSKKALNFFSKFIFVFELLLFAALVIYITLSQLFPLKYIFVLIAFFGVLTGVHIWLLSGRKKFTAKRTVSLVLSIIIFLTSAFGIIMFGTVQGSIWGFLNHDESDSGVNVTKEPFIVYLSGMDTRNSGEIVDKGLSDVNMIIVVDPRDAELLMVSIPRDYYLPLWGEADKMDKLTHSGRYGIDCSMSTLEAAFGIKFNYYVKVNFKSVYDIVNAVGGITVNSDYNFSSKYSYTETVYKFVKGPNTIDGDAALAFARERNSFAAGDRQRVKDQQEVIRAVIDKAMSPAILNPAKLKNVLSAVTENTKTDMSYNEISALVRYQLDKNPKWDIKSMSVDGSNASEYTYSYPKQKLYVMRPKTETVDEAVEAIKQVLGHKETEE